MWLAPSVMRLVQLSFLVPTILEKRMLVKLIRITTGVSPMRGSLTDSKRVQKDKKVPVQELPLAS